MNKQASISGIVVVVVVVFRYCSCASNRSTVTAPNSEITVIFGVIDGVKVSRRVGSIALSSSLCLSTLQVKVNLASSTFYSHRFDE